MPTIGFMEIQAENQGKIEGSLDMEEGTIEIYAFTHRIEIPMDPRYGLPTGKRVHRPAVVNKEVDKSTPKLYKALCESENLVFVELTWYKPTGLHGKKENYYTVRFENALITRIEPVSPQRLDISKETFVLLEDISFAYERIIWTWVSDGIEHEDIWEKPA